MKTHHHMPSFFHLSSFHWLPIGDGRSLVSPPFFGACAPTQLSMTQSQSVSIIHLPNIFRYVQIAA